MPTQSYRCGSLIATRLQIVYTAIRLYGYTAIAGAKRRVALAREPGGPASWIARRLGRQGASARPRMRRCRDCGREQDAGRLAGWPVGSVQLGPRCVRERLGKKLPA